MIETALPAIAELQTLLQWCCFKKEKRVETDDKDTKVPYHPKGYRASSSKSATWSNHEAVVRACRVTNLFSGIGFFFSGQIYSGIDIDDCVDEHGNIADWAWEIIRLLDSYTEFSTSGTGVHIVVKGLLQLKALDKDGVEYIKGWKNNPQVGDVPKGKLELYSERRFFVVTGNHVPGTPTTINERQDQLLSILNKFFIEPKEEKQREFYKKSPKLPDNYQPAEIPQDDYELWQIIFREKGNGARSERLYYGDASDYMGDNGTIDESAADMGQANKLVFYTRHDASRVERMMWQTALVRDKWTSHPTYLKLTIDNAMGTVREDYDPGYYKREAEKQNARMNEERDAMMYKEAVSPNGHINIPQQDQEYIPSCKKHVFEAGEVQNKDILVYMDAQQLGDAQLLARCFEGQVAYDSFEGEWYLWKGHHWGRDIHDHIRVLVSGHLGSVYLGATKPLNEERAQLNRELEQLGPNDKETKESLEKEIKEIDKLIKALIQRAKELRKRTYNTGVLYFAESLLAIPTRGDGTSVWDSLTGKIGVKNGVLDLRTGICRDGEPDDYIRTFSPTEWKGLNAQCPLFLNKFLDELFMLRRDKKEVIQFLIRLLGYALTGTCKEAIFAILYGPEGRNGKSTLFKIITAALGKALVGSIAKELLIDTGKNQQANGPKPDVLDLQGKRIAIAAETEKGAKLNISAIKHYTGDDELGGRPVFGKHKTRFEPTHTLFLHTNFKPHADPSDSAFWARACLIEFGMRFIEEPDPNKPNELKYDTGLARHIIEEELPGVLACLVRGAMDYDKNGLRKPESVKLASEAYRVSEDTLQTFINECCEVRDGLSIPSSSFITAYKEWSGDGFKLTSKELKKQMEKKGFKLRSTNKANVYDGIKFAGEGQGSSGSKTDSVEGSGSNENAYQSASEADPHKNSGRSGSSLPKVPHEGTNKCENTKLFETASTPSTNDNSDSCESALEAGSQQSGRKNSASTPEFLPPLESNLANDAAQPQLIAGSDFMAIGKRLGYPEIPDLDLKGGMTGWNSYIYTHRLRMPDVIARLGVKASR